MDQDADNRDDFRYKHRAKILLEACFSGAYYQAKMFNYSSGGLYFESDYAPLPGTDIFISIENSPYDFGADVYRAQVRWRTELSKKKSKYSFGVGVRYNQPQGG
jgi:hypothetical protein